MAHESAAGNGATPCITVRDLTMAYGSFVLMRDMTFTVNRGDVFIIMGGSGSGKSTLLRHLIGLNQPAHGSIYYEGQRLHDGGAEPAGTDSQRCRGPVSGRRPVERDDPE